MFVASGERPKSKVSIKQEVKVKYSFLQNQSRYKVSREHSKKLSVHFYSVNFTLKIKLKIKSFHWLFEIAEKLKQFSIKR